MAREINVTKRHDSGLVDSDTGKDCVTEKVVDVTEDCPSGSPKKKLIFLFTRAKRGRIVQMMWPHEGKDFGGSFIHFFVNELDAQFNVRPMDDTFGQWANRFGLHKLVLRDLIVAHAPA